MMGIRNKCGLSVLFALWCLAEGYDSSPRLNLVCSPEASDRCKIGGYSVNDHFYVINGETETISFVEGNTFSMSCLHTPLNDSALPQFPRRVSFKLVSLTHCVPPDAATSYIAALAGLNVTVVEKLVVRSLPPGTRLTAAALAGLPATVTELDIEASGSVHLEPDTLISLEHIRKLWLNKVRPDELPQNLTLLNLRSTGLNSLPALPADLVSLHVVEKSLTDFTPLANLSNLRELHLSARLEGVPQLPAGLVNLTLVSLAESAPAPLLRCEQLRRLTVMRGAVRLPAGWLAACPRLQYLALTQQPRLASLPADLLRGATELRELHIRWCTNLTTLPEDLFKYSPNIKVLNLSHNKLETLPSDVFSPLSAQLEELDLSYNGLGAVGACAAVAPLGSLAELSLSHNALGDLCRPLDTDIQTSVSSCFSYRMKQTLSKLALSYTNASRVCADYLSDMPSLRRLDLTNNAIENLTLSELNKMHRDEPSDVDLTGNPLTSVFATEDDLLAGRVDHIVSKGTILLRQELTCDCHMYWFARALRKELVGVRIEATCAGGAAVRSVPPDQLECRVQCAPCECAYRPHVGGLRASCPAAPPQGLLRAPPEKLKLLSLVGAGLAELPQPLPEGLLGLDLDNNSISRNTGGAGEAMFASVQQVRLTRNPLACDCARDSLLPLLRARRNQLTHLNQTTCADGRPLAEALELECSPTAGGAGGVAAALAVLGAAVAAAAALAALLSRAEPRLRIKAWLHARGLRGLWAGSRACERDNRLFDAFVSHAPHDARFVALHLAPALQKKGYKLCLKDRDWPPGAWIPSQIEASLAASRRTIAVVSPPPAPAPPAGGPAAGAADGAGWAEAELRAAHAASLREKRSRLIIVCVGELPDSVKSVARSHVALRWGAPHFWDRLLYALPPLAPKTKTAAA